MFVLPSVLFCCVSMSSGFTLGFTWTSNQIEFVFTDLFAFSLVFSLTTLTHECVAQALDPSHLELISLLSHAHGRCAWTLRYARCATARAQGVLPDAAIILSPNIRRNLNRRILLLSST